MSNSTTRSALRWRIACVIVGVAFAVGTIVFVKPAQALGMCASGDRCATYAQAQVHNFKRHRIGNSAHLTFPRSFKREFGQAMRQWRRHHHAKGGVPNPFAPIVEFVTDETGKAACGLSTAVAGGSCNSVGTGAGGTWPSTARFRDNMGYVADVTIGCGGGALIASFQRPANWRVLATRYGYRWNPWVLGTGFSACTFGAVWATTHGH
jgi:hypothetical protein